MTADNANAYLRTKVLTAKPEQLRLMLLEGAVKFTRQGREGLLSTPRNHEQVFMGFDRARNILVELIGSIRPDTDPTLRSRVQGLYTFIFQLLVDANFQKDATKADKAIELLEYERETWLMAIRQAALDRAEATASPAPAMATTAHATARPALSVQG